MESFKEIEQKAWKDWLESKVCRDAIAITITFCGESSISALDAQKAMHVFSRMLNKEAYGKKFIRGEKKLTWIAVIEGGSGQADKRIHYHLLVERPEGWSYEDWMLIAKDRAGRIACFSKQQLCIKRVHDDGWLDYILKTKDKRSFTDAIDVANLWVN